MHVRVFWAFIWLGVLALPTLGNSQPFRRALRYWNQQNWEALQSHLDQVLTKGEPAPGESYLYSRLYTHAESRPMVLDSALAYIRAAQRDWHLASNRDQARYGRLGVTDSIISQQKAWVDSAGYALAQTTHTERGYRRFIVNHFDAAELDQARSDMYALAYAAAQSEDTYRAYVTFWTEHPQAPQVSEAKERAAVVAYKEETVDKTPASYRRFLEKFPNSPIRSQAERELLALTTLDFQPEAFRSFITSYPQSKFRSLAVALLFHLEKELGKANEFLAASTSWPEWDSLLGASRVEMGRLFPLWEGDEHSMWYPAEGKVIPQRYDDIPDSVCETGWPYAWLPIKTDHNGYRVVNRNGISVFSSGIEQLRDLGYGFVASKRQGKWGVSHLGRHEILPSAYEAVRMVIPGWIAAKTRNGWSFFSAMGKKNPISQVEGFQVLGPYLLLERGGLWAPFLLSKFKRPSLDEEASLDFRWEDFELLDNGQLLLIGEDTEAIWDATGKFVVPEGPYVLEDVGFGWLAESSQGFGIAFHGRRGLNPPFYQDVQFSKGWLALKRGQRWALVHPDEGFTPDYRYDSARVLGEDIFYLKEGSKVTLLLGDSTELLISANDQFRVLKNPEQDVNAPDWVLHIQEDSSYLYTDYGYCFWGGESDFEISRVSSYYATLTQDDSWGMINDQGSWSFTPSFDGVGQLREGIIPLLSESQFGIYWTALDTLSPPQWDQVPLAYSDTLAITNTEGKLGLFGASGTQHLDARFDEIRYWNDSSALCKLGYSWEIRHIKRDSLILGEISQVTEHKYGEWLIKTETGYGLLHPTRGTLIHPELDALEWVGEGTDGFWRGSNYVPAAAWYIFSYFDRFGRRLHRQTIDERDLDRVFCE